MADPLRAALRVVRERLTDDGFRAAWAREIGLDPRAVDLVALPPA